MELDETYEFSTQELKLSEHEIDMLLLENQIKDNNMRSKNVFVKFLKRIFRGNL